MSEIFGTDLSFSADMNGSGGSVKVGGHDISDSISAFTVDATAGHRPRVTLRLNVHDATRIESEHTEVVMSPATRGLLTDAGWQPPAELTAERTAQLDARFADADEGEGLLT